MLSISTPIAAKISVISLLKSKSPKISVSTNNIPNLSFPTLANGIAGVAKIPNLLANLLNLDKGIPSANFLDIACPPIFSSLSQAMFASTFVANNCLFLSLDGVATNTSTFSAFSLSPTNILLSSVMLIPLEITSSYISAAISLDS